ncbi:MAG: hypothetical protein GXC73_00165 [Chitinophagaceae bacterium]|nr:hypothetical protein [Chitinophagaceae bacterium]
MKIHKAIVRDSFIHLLFSFAIFLLVNFYTKNEDAGLFYLFGYFSCLAFFTMILPLFVSEKARRDVQIKPYWKGTMIVLFMNVFVPFVGALFARSIYDLIK